MKAWLRGLIAFALAGLLLSLATLFLWWLFQISPRARRIEELGGYCHWQVPFGITRVIFNDPDDPPTDEDLHVLVQTCPELKNLRLFRAEITAQGLCSLKAFDSLRYLTIEIDVIAISDPQQLDGISLHQLKQYMGPSLKTTDIRRDDITLSQMERLAEKLDGCTIVLSTVEGGIFKIWSRGIPDSQRASKADTPLFLPE